MPAIAIRGEVAKCHVCGVTNILDGHGKCQICFDQEVDSWVSPIYAKPIKSPEWQIKNKTWQHKYYVTHKPIIIARQVEANRRRRLEHPELLIKERERHREDREKKRHPCADCGKPCNKESTRCRTCYHAILRTEANGMRGYINAFWESKGVPRNSLADRIDEVKEK